MNSEQTGIKLSDESSWYHTHKAQHYAGMRKWVLDNPEKNREYKRKWNNANTEYKRQYREAHLERTKEAIKEWKRLNPGKVAASNQLRRARKLQATPKWLTKDQIKEIEMIYINRPEGCHVDHIIPLRGDGVCGLHVPWNLQYLSSGENLRKNKRY